MRSAPRPSLPLNRCLLGASVCPNVPPAIHTVLQPSTLKVFNIFHFSHLPPLCVSLPSFFARRPVFSITSSLFLQNAGVGVPPQVPLLESATYGLFFRALLAKQL